MVSAFSLSLSLSVSETEPPLFVSLLQAEGVLMPAGVWRRMAYSKLRTRRTRGGLEEDEGEDEGEEEEEEESLFIANAARIKRRRRRKVHYS